MNVGWSAVPVVGSDYRLLCGKGTHKIRGGYSLLLGGGCPSAGGDAHHQQQVGMQLEISVRLPRGVPINCYNHDVMTIMM